MPSFHEVEALHVAPISRPPNHRLQRAQSEMRARLSPEPCAAPAPPRSAPVSDGLEKHYDATELKSFFPSMSVAAIRRMIENVPGSRKLPRPRSIRADGRTTRESFKTVIPHSKLMAWLDSHTLKPAPPAVEITRVSDLRR